MVMAASALVQVRIDPELKERAAAVLDHMGLTVSDAVRILLTRIANEGALPFDFMVDPQVYDAWFRAKVQEALDDPRPAIAAEAVDAHFAARRAAARRAAGGKDDGNGNGSGGDDNDGKETA
jgi:DNA-damage-inducible protein J